MSNKCKIFSPSPVSWKLERFRQPTIFVDNGSLDFNRNIFRRPFAFQNLSLCKSNWNLHGLLLTIIVEIELFNVIWIYLKQKEAQRINVEVFDHVSDSVAVKRGT